MLSKSQVFIRLWVFINGLEKLEKIRIAYLGRIHFTRLHCSRADKINRLTLTAKEKNNLSIDYLMTNALPALGLAREMKMKRIIQ